MPRFNGRSFTYGRRYPHHRYVDHDPILDWIIDRMRASGHPLTRIAEDSGVTLRTLIAWSTYRRKRATYTCIAAVAKSLGYSRLPLHFTTPTKRPAKQSAKQKELTS